MYERRIISCLYRNELNQNYLPLSITKSALLEGLSVLEKIYPLNSLNMITIRHTGIVTKNLDKSLIFWQKLIGFKQVNSQIERGDLIGLVLGYENVKVRTIKLKDKNKNLIELLYFYNSPNKAEKKINPYTPGYTYFNYS